MGCYFDPAAPVAKVLICVSHERPKGSALKELRQRCNRNVPPLSLEHEDKGDDLTLTTRFQPSHSFQVDPDYLGTFAAPFASPFRDGIDASSMKESRSAMRSKVKAKMIKKEIGLNAVTGFVYKFLLMCLHHIKAS